MVSQNLVCHLLYLKLYINYVIMSNLGISSKTGGLFFFQTEEKEITKRYRRALFVRRAAQRICKDALYEIQREER